MAQYSRLPFSDSVFFAFDQLRSCATKILPILCIAAIICIYALTRTSRKDADTSAYSEFPSRPHGIKWDKFRIDLLDKKMNYNLVNKIRVNVKFVVGRPNDDKLLERLLLYEMNEMEDLIISTIPDTYENLNIKVYAALQWQQAYCPGAAFVLKADDDVVLDPTRLIYWIDNKFANQTKDGRPAIFGNLLIGSPIIRSDSKWKVLLEELSGDVYPDYTLGMTYMLTGAAVTKLLMAAPQVKIFKFEDVLFTGLMAQKANVTHYQANDFFRNTDVIDEKEKCQRSVPLLSSVFGYGADKIPQMYKKLRDVKCKE